MREERRGSEVIIMLFNRNGYSLLKTSTKTKNI